MTTVIFFAANDSSYGDELWETDGTTLGTFAVGGIDDAGVTNAQESGLDPQHLAAFQNELLFEGSDIGGNYGTGLGFWVSNGANAGTYEVGGIYDAGVNGAYSSGLQPYNFVTFGSEALFLGVDTTGRFGIWVTNGTASGTTEIGGVGNSGINGKYFNGLGASKFTALGNEVVFTGNDTDDSLGLWITDGTAAGTTEIGGLKNAGITGASPTQFDPTNFIAVGSELLFDAVDSSGYDGLWVTNGTALGTTEIGGLKNAGVSGATAGGLDGAGYTVSGTVFGAKLLFDCPDGLWITDGSADGTTRVAASGASSLGVFGSLAAFDGSGFALWVTDGTAAGTTEIGGTKNAEVQGANPSGLNPLVFGAIGDKTLFVGEDASGQYCLWVTDGTLAGTSEIGGVNNAGVTGAYAGGLDPSAFVTNGQEAFFQASNSSDQYVLWVSDGTVSGTHAVTGVTGEPSAGFYAENLTAVTLPSPTTISSGNSPYYISSGQSAFGDIVIGGGVIEVESGGTMSATTVSSGGEEYIGSGGTSLAAQVLGGGAEVVFGSDSGAGVSGTQYDFSTARGGTTFSGGYQLVASGATASGMTIELGGEQYVGSGGTTLGAQVQAGGAEVVFGSDSGASLSGTQYLYGTARGGTTYSGGFQLVASGATASGMTVAFGGEQYVGSGGTTLSAQVKAGGAEVVNGFDSGASVSGTQYDYGVALGGTTYNGGEQLVASGATASGMTAESGGQQYIGAGGTALATDVAAQGVEVIFGHDSGALVSGTQYVFGIASGGTTFNDGSQQIEPGGTAIGMTVSGFGLQNVGAGGTAIGTRIMSQGAETVHGTDLGATISGTQYVFGLASGTVVGTGGYQLVSAGGTTSAASISGGTIELMNGAANGAAPITFAGAGELILDASTTFSGTVAGFGSASQNDTIDFADISYVPAGSAGATTITWNQLTSGANASGTLMVAQGGHTADVTLLGQYVAGNFTPSGDGHGGTLVIDPPVAPVTDANPQVLTAARHA